MEEINKGGNSRTEGRHYGRQICHWQSRVCVLHSVCALERIVGWSRIKQGFVGKVIN